MRRFKRAALRATQSTHGKAWAWLQAPTDEGVGYSLPRLSVGTKPLPNSQLTADANNANIDGDESEECLEMSITTPVQVSAAGLAHVGTGCAVTHPRI